MISVGFLWTLVLSLFPDLVMTVPRNGMDTGLLLHFQSHVDNRYKRGLVNTMVDRAYRLSSNKEAFFIECDKLRTIFSKLSYPKEMINSTIHRFGQDRTEHNATPQLDPSVYIRLPFTDQRSANRVRREIHSLESKIDIRIQPVFTSKKLS